MRTILIAIIVLCFAVPVVAMDKYPDRIATEQDYKNLLVRITGYNAYFVTLGKEIQDEIIARESHNL